MIRSVYFRLPGEKDVFCLREQEGNDSFIIQAFDKSKHPVVLKGCFEIVGNEAVQAALDSWKLEQCLKSDQDERHFIDLVNSAIAEINIGTFQKVVLARTKLIRSQTKISDLFRDLLKIYPDAFVYIFNIDGKCMVGASPESLLSFDSEALKTDALGGTRTHGEFTEKEEIEHQQIVEYVGHILGAKEYGFTTGTREVKKAGQVEHYHTGFTIESKGLNEDLQLANSLHPTSAVCGLPYSAAMNFINSKEGFERNYYSGFLGPIFSDGKFSMFVNLRCAEIYEGVFKLFAGAGINSMSNAKDELLETNNKMLTIGQCLK